MSYARIVQPGTGMKRLIVLLYLIHPDRDAAIRDALGPKPIILARTDDGDPGPALTYEEASIRHRLNLPPPTEYLAGLVLGGWSSGCSGVRKRLLEIDQDGWWKKQVRAFALADGTHASFPPEAWQLDVWRPWIEQARRGNRCVDGGPNCVCDICSFRRRIQELTFAASHTYQTYVERLPGTRRYTSTVNVLRSLTGLDLPRPGLLSGPSEHHDNGLHIESYPSADIDGSAHIRQQTETLPGMLRRYVRPIVERAYE